MSVKLMTMVFEADERLKATQKLVMLALADHAADDGTSIYPSIQTIAYKTGLNESSVRKVLKELRDGDLKLIKIARHYTSHRPNQYSINMTKLASIKRVLPDSTQEFGVLPRSTQGATKKHSRVLPRSTDPSITINEPSALDASRPRDFLFDAIAEVCQIDPTMNGSKIGKIKQSLLKANPPFTPEEVKAFGALWWSWDQRAQPPTVWQLADQINKVRAKRPNSNGPIRLTGVVHA